MHNKSVNQCPQLTDDRWQKQKQQRQKKKKKKKKRGTNAGRKMQADMSYNNRASTLSNVEQTARLTVFYSTVHILNE
ncbi:KAT8 regulatory NSL complex subunit 1-like protein [Trichinella pseudospiralis]